MGYWIMNKTLITDLGRHEFPEERFTNDEAEIEWAYYSQHDYDRDNWDDDTVEFTKEVGDFLMTIVFKWIEEEN